MANRITRAKAGGHLRCCCALVGPPASLRSLESVVTTSGPAWLSSVVGEQQGGGFSPILDKFMGKQQTMRQPTRFQHPCIQMNNSLSLRGLVHGIGLAVLGLPLLAPLPAQGPVNHPQNAGTIKATMSVDLAPVFARQMKLIESRRGAWLQQAEKATPKLLCKPMAPVEVVAVEKDAASFQGWRTVATEKPESVCNKPLLPGDSFTLDFGEHFTGQFLFSLRRFDIPVDAPVRLALIFGEMPAEVAKSFDPFPGTLTRSWKRCKSPTTEMRTAASAGVSEKAGPGERSHDKHGT